MPISGCRKGFEFGTLYWARTISIAKLGFDDEGSSSFYLDHRRFQNVKIIQGLADAHEASLQILLDFS
jgi:hypothetical protein